MIITIITIIIIIMIMIVITIRTTLRSQTTKEKNHKGILPIQPSIILSLLYFCFSPFPPPPVYRQERGGGEGKSRDETS